MSAQNKMSSPLHRLRVLVVAVQSYGNLGDELETAPLFYRLHEWGVEQLDALLAPFTLKMAKDYNSEVPPALAKAGSLNPSIVGTVYRECPRLENYDVIIHAPGPHCYNDLLDAACKANVPVVIYGISLKSKDQARKLWSNRSCLRLVAIREPRSMKILLRIIKESTFVIRFPWNKESTFVVRVPLPWNTKCQVPMVMSSDIGMTFEDYADYAKLDIFREEFSQALPRQYVVFFPRGKLREQTVMLSKNKNSKSLSIRATGRVAKEWKITTDVVFATSDPDWDADMFKSLQSEWPDIQQVSCTSIEQMWALIQGSQAVYTARYHPGVSTLINKKSLIVLPSHPGEIFKMEGLKQESTKLSYEQMKNNNAKAWKSLYSALANIQLENYGVSSETSINRPLT